MKFHAALAHSLAPFVQTLCGRWGKRKVEVQCHALLLRRFHAYSTGVVYSVGSSVLGLWKLAVLRQYFTPTSLSPNSVLLCLHAAVPPHNCPQNIEYRAPQKMCLPTYSKIEPPPPPVEMCSSSPPPPPHAPFRIFGHTRPGRCYSRHRSSGCVQPSN